MTTTTKLASRTVTVTLRADDAEPIVWQAAYDAAKYGACLDYVTRRTRNSPGGLDYDANRVRWHAAFVRAKRLLAAFGLDPEPTSEEETLTVSYDHVGGKRKRVIVGGLLQYYRIEGGGPDYKHPQPAYRGEVHSMACRAAADRVVRRWKERG